MINDKINFHHVGISVTNLEKAIKFYRDTFDIKQVMAPKIINQEDNLIKKRRKDVFGSQIKEVKVAFLITNNNVGIELFEFKNPLAEKREKNFEYWKTGIFHLCFEIKHFEIIIKKIKENGGKIRSKIWELFPGSGSKMAYCEDPFGNIFEIISCSYLEMVSQDFKK